MARPTITIRVDLITQDDADQDENDSTGLTVKAYERLVDAIRSAGFDITDGPTGLQFGMRIK